MRTHIHTHECVHDGCDFVPISHMGVKGRVTEEVWEPGCMQQSRTDLKAPNSPNAHGLQPKETEALTASLLPLQYHSLHHSNPKWR